MHGPLIAKFGRN